MSNDKNFEINELETKEWLYSLDYVLEHGGPERVKELLQQLQIRAHKAGISIPFTANTPYINTIVPDSAKLYGDLMLQFGIQDLITESGNFDLIAN